MLKTMEAKRAYIIQCMNSTIDDLLKSWREKVDAQEKSQQGNNKEYENIKNRHNEEIRDRFPWLTLKTKYSLNFIGFIGKFKFADTFHYRKN